MPKIEAVGSEGLVFDSQEFSTSETDSGRRWIDGGIIYQKSFAVSGPNKNISGTVTDIITHSITGLDLVIEVKGYITEGSFTMPLPSPMGAQASPTGVDGATGKRTVAVLINETSVLVMTGTDIEDFSGYVMLLYTKT